MKLITGKAAANFAKQFGMDRHFAVSVNDKTLADRFESYIGALWVFKGNSAVLEFLAPLFGRELLKVAVEDVKEVAEKEVVKPASGPTSSQIGTERKKEASTTDTKQVTIDEAITDRNESRAGRATRRQKTS